MINTMHDENEIEVWFNDSNMPPSGKEMPALSKGEEKELFEWMDKEFLPESVDKSDVKGVSVTGQIATA